MSFSATLYNCSDDPKKLSKNLTGGLTVSSITPTESCDILSPTFILNYNSSYTSCNYIVVGAPFNRSYFITDMKIDIGKKIVISCSVDVLETYKLSIKNINTTIYRNEDYKKSAPYLPDSEYQVKSGFQYYYETFKMADGSTSAFHGDGYYSYVLSWIGNEIDTSDTYIPIYAEPSDWETSWGDYYYKDENTYYSLLILFPTSAPPFEVAQYEVRHDFQSDIYANIGS